MPPSCNHPTLLVALFFLLLTLATPLVPSHNGTSYSSIVLETTDKALKSTPFLSQTRLSFSWTNQGAPIAAPVVKALLYKALNNFHSEDPDEVVRWEDAMTSLPGYANFDLEPEQGAQYSLVWRGAISAVDAMMLKMKRDGYYEGSAAIFVPNRVLVGEMALFKESRVAKRRLKNAVADGGAIPLLDTITTPPAMEKSTTEMPTATSVADHGTLSLYITHRGRSMNYRHIKPMFAAAIGAAQISIRDGRGDEVASWKQLTWKDIDVRMSIWPHQGTRHPLNWKKVFKTLELTLNTLRYPRDGYRTLDADIVWAETREPEEMIGEIHVGIDSNLEKRNSTDAAALKTDVDNVNLRITTRGLRPQISARRANSLLFDAMSTVRADVADGMGDQVIASDHIQWKAEDILFLRITPNRSVTNAINWRVVLKVLDLIQDRLHINNYRSFNADIIVFSGDGHAFEYIGKSTLYETSSNDLEAITNDTLEISTDRLTLGNTTLTAANLTTATLTTGENKITLRYEQEGFRLDQVRVKNLFFGAIGTVEDNVAAGKGDDPVQWKDMKFHGKGIRLKIVIYQSAKYRLNWNMMVTALMLMVGQLKHSGCKEYEADIVYNDDFGKMLEIIGRMELAKIIDDGSDTA